MWIGGSSKGEKLAAYYADKDAEKAAAEKAAAEKAAAASAPKEPRRSSRDWIRSAQSVARGRSFAPLLHELPPNPMAADWVREMSRKDRSGSESRQAAMHAAKTRMMRERLTG